MGSGCRAQAVQVCRFCSTLLWLKGSGDAEGSSLGFRGFGFRAKGVRVRVQG